MQRVTLLKMTHSFQHGRCDPVCLHAPSFKLRLIRKIKYLFPVLEPVPPGSSLTILYLYPSTRHRPNKIMFIEYLIPDKSIYLLQTTLETSVEKLHCCNTNKQAAWTVQAGFISIFLSAWMC